MHNDRRRKRSQANTVAAANQRPVRTSAGIALGAIRTEKATDASASTIAGNPPPLPSVRTASGFGLSRPPSGAYYASRAYCGSQPAFCSGYAAAGAAYSAADMETARRASEPAANLGRAAAGFLSKASALLGRSSSRAAAMHGSTMYDGMRPTDSTFSLPLPPGSMHIGGGSSSNYSSGGAMQTPDYGGIAGGSSLVGCANGMQGMNMGVHSSPFELTKTGNVVDGGGGYEDSCDAQGSLQSVRTPSGRVVNLKRRGSVNNEMRNLNIHGVRLHICIRHHCMLQVSAL